MEQIIKKEGFKLITHKSLIDWCNEQVKDGGKLSMGWDGGDDSGWVWLEKDGVRIGESILGEPLYKIEEAEKLRNLMYDLLDYGSWAGEFHATGLADWDPETNSFVGEDDYEERTRDVHNCSYLLQIDKNIWFDRIEVDFDGHDSVENVEVSIIVVNGFTTKEHRTTENKLENDIISWLKVEIGNLNSNTTDFSYYEMIDRSAFKEVGNMLVYEINKLDVDVNENLIKPICLTLDPNNSDNDLTEEDV
jgi:hypothetical protein